MAEFCKKCFVDKLLNVYERADFYNGHLNIVMSEEPDLCEGCGEITQVVDYVEEM